MPDIVINPSTLTAAAAALRSAADSLGRAGSTVLVSWCAAADGFAPGQVAGALLAGRPALALSLDAAASTVSELAAALDQAARGYAEAEGAAVPRAVG